MTIVFIGRVFIGIDDRNRILCIRPITIFDFWHIMCQVVNLIVKHIMYTMIVFQTKQSWFLDLKFENTESG